MIIKVTDKELLNTTGGIIQGMSGAPIVQNGKFIGAITHVLISDPTTGYRGFRRPNGKANASSKIVQKYNIIT